MCDATRKSKPKRETDSQSFLRPFAHRSLVESCFLNAAQKPVEVRKNTLNGTISFQTRIFLERK
jgi:hypothetical protein